MCDTTFRYTVELTAAWDAVELVVQNFLGTIGLKTTLNL